MVDPHTTNPKKFWGTKLGSLVLGILGWVIFLGVWQVLSSSEILKLPGPASLMMEGRTRELLLNPFFDKGGIDKGLFWLSIFDLQHVLMSCFGAGAVGIGLGILLGVNQVLRKLFVPVIAFLQILPPLILLPFAVAAANQNVLFVLDFWIALWPILSGTMMGVTQSSEDYRSIGQVPRRSKNQFFQAMIPLLLPYILKSIRKAIVLTWCVHVSLGVYVSPGTQGIGSFIWEAYQNNYISSLLLVLIYVGVIALILDYSIRWIQHKIASTQEQP